MKEDTRKKKRALAKEDDADTAAEEQKGFFSSRLSIVLIAIVGLAFVVYALISLSGINSQIRERTEELNEIKDEITVQEIKNDSMSKTYNLSDSERTEFMERLARDELDFVKEGERVFVNVAGE
ncbi:MAG: septum formation initiator family protein [Ruminococcus sp.]|nr:septum formation initiator family protein [Ruminococcus sp.]